MGNGRSAIDEDLATIDCRITGKVEVLLRHPPLPRCASSYTVTLKSARKSRRARGVYPDRQREHIGSSAACARNTFDDYGRRRLNLPPLSKLATIPVITLVTGGPALDQRPEDLAFQSRPPFVSGLTGCEVIGRHYGSVRKRCREPFGEVGLPSPARPVDRYQARAFARSLEDSPGEVSVAFDSRPLVHLVDRARCRARDNPVPGGLWEVPALDPLRPRHDPRPRVKA
jgi:hypothetical protein